MVDIWRRRQQIVPVDHIQFHPELSESARRCICRCLGRCTELDADSRIVSESFRELEIDPEAIKSCGEFESGDYNRVELASCDAWVLLALFWDNTETCIHDHDESECGFRIIAGELEETRFSRVAEGKVREVARRRLIEGIQVSSHREAIHRLSTLNGKRAISLHAYSPCLDTEDMNVFEEVDSQD